MRESLWLECSFPNMVTELTPADIPFWARAAKYFRSLTRGDLRFCHKTAAGSGLVHILLQVCEPSVVC